MPRVGRAATSDIAAADISTGFRAIAARGWGSHPSKASRSSGHGVQIDLSPAGPWRAWTGTVFAPGPWFGQDVVMATVVNGLDELKSKVGEVLGTSEPVTITQEQVNLFADATGDHQWIHVDVERAKAGPFGGPIAHGYLTLSLAPMLMEQVLTLKGVAMGVNYGCNKVRFPSPVPVGATLAMTARLLEVEDVAGGAQYIVELTFQVDGASKPSCVAECIYRAYA
jgi:acyl dehydratase